MRRIHIFKAGRQTDSHGTQLDFSAADLARTASSYSAALHEAPIVVGHPEQDHPAFGWIKSITAEGSDLYATPHQVNPEFAELVRAGSFKKVSVSLYTPGHPQNPAPGAYYLRHVGYLGAMPPAIKGLAPTEFAATDANCIELELDFAEGAAEPSTTGSAAPVTPAEPLSLSPAPQARTPGTGASPEGLAPATPATPASAPSPTTPEPATVTPEQATALKTQNDQLAADLASAQGALRAQAAASKAAEHAAFAETLVAQARCAAAHAPLITAALAYMDPPVSPGDKPTVVSFGEGAAAVPLVEAFKAFLSAQPAQVTFGEQASHGRVVSPCESQGVTYAEGTPAEHIALDQRIRTYAAANKVTYPQAAIAVANQS